MKDLLFYFLIFLIPYVLIQQEGFAQPDSNNQYAVEFSTIVYQAGEENYDFYRIPSLLLAGQRLYAFVEGRKNSLSDNGQIDIVLKISDDFGKTWQDLIPVTNFKNQSCQNPTTVYIIEENKILLLFTKRTVASDTEDKIRDGTAEGYIGAYATESLDNGNTWSEVREITNQVKLKKWLWYAFGPGGAIILQNNSTNKGRIIIPSNHSINGGKDNEFLGAHVVYSDDLGKSWHIGAVDSEGLGSVNPNELTVIETQSGTLFFNTRNQNDHPDSISNRAITYSQDGGIAFSRKFFHEPRLVTPVVHASLTRTNGKIIFIAPFDFRERKNLSLWISKDETLTWDRPILIHEGFSAYSSSVMLNKHTLGVLFETGIDFPYQQILFKTVTVD